MELLGAAGRCYSCDHPPRNFCTLDRAERHTLSLELIAWLCITCTYIGFAPAELLLGPRKGLTRLLDQPWTMRRLYLAVYLGILGAAVLGLSLLAAPLNNHIALTILALLLVVYHFVLRHFTTERKGTPHLGQRGPNQERTVEVLWGQLGDLYLLVVLLVIWWLTKHPVWLLGTAILLAGYILGVGFTGSGIQNPGV